jgi:hypothetical protein
LAQSLSQGMPGLSQVIAACVVDTLMRNTPTQTDRNGEQRGGEGGEELFAGAVGVNVSVGAQADTKYLVLS